MEEEINSSLLRKKKIIKISMITMFIFIALFILSLFNFSKFEIMKALTGVFLILFLCNVFFIFFYKEKALNDIKKEIFNSIIPEIFESATYMQQGIPRNMYNESKLYLNYNTFFSSDRVKKGMNQLDISNVVAKLNSQNASNTIFKGVFAIMKLDDFYKDEVVIKPDYENKFVSTLVDGKNKILGENESVVRLENLEFEKYFEVYSKDQIKARQLITVEYMENMVKLKQSLNTLIKVRYYGDKKYVAIWNKRLIDEKDFYKNGIKLDKIKENIKEIYEAIQTV